MQQNMRMKFNAGSMLSYVGKTVNPNRRRARGMTLIETAMVLGLAALVAAGVMYFFTSANNGQKTNEAVSQLAAIQQATRSMFAGQPTYDGLTAQILAESRQLPNKMVNGTALQNSFGGDITIGTANANTNFTVQFSGLPGEACVRMSTMDLGTGLVNIAVTGGTAANVDGRPMTPVEANSACGTGNSTSITWTLF